jgi:predicted GNAT family N-acyltransferase
MVVRPIADAAELEAALALRIEVFCAEQGVSRDAEIDGRDDDARHLVALQGDAVVGTCRLIHERQTVLVQRVAVRREHRHTGLGSALLAFAEREARRLGATSLELHAQVASERFYRAVGYESYGERFLEEGIEHIAMRRPLSDARP